MCRNDPRKLGGKEEEKGGRRGVQAISMTRGKGGGEGEWGV